MTTALVSWGQKVACVGLNIAQAGDRAVLVSFETISAADLRGRAAQVQRLPGFLKAIVGHSSLYVVFDRPPDEGLIGKAMAAPLDPSIAPSVRRQVITVSFHESYGPDLPALLRQAGLTRDAFLARVSGIRLEARYLGFRGGFAYLDGWPEEWAMPRQLTSRPVAAGSFAIAGNVAGFYPIDTPGGWNILGRTNMELSIAPGDEIELRPTIDVLTFTQRLPPPAPEVPHVKIIQGPAASVVTGDTAFDLEAAALAARAVGNNPDVPLIECALVAPRIRVTGDAIGSWFGAETDLRVNGRSVGDRRQFELRADDEVTGGRITHGMRGYLAIGTTRGDVGALNRGDRLTIRAGRGPHDIGLDTIECEVTPKLDRVGIRMTPTQPLDVDVPADLRSCGMQCGTLQLHPDGSIVAMGPDHPVTGGYLQPMTVLSSERWKLAQLMPGERVRFVAYPP
jgi:allophanate hydrolase subunit 1